MGHCSPNPPALSLVRLDDLPGAVMRSLLDLWSCGNLLLYQPETFEHKLKCPRERSEFAQVRALAKIKPGLEPATQRLEVA